MNNKVQFVGIVACVPKGDWQSNLTYDLLNIVRHNNASWVATTTVPANNEPLEGSQYWNLLVKDGENGSGGSAITIDDALSLTSTNPVQNKVIALALNEKQAILVSGVNIKTINNQPLLGEGNLEIEGGSGITVDTELSDTSTNPVENQAVTKALGEKVGVFDPPFASNVLFIQKPNSKEIAYRVFSSSPNEVRAAYVPSYFTATYTPTDVPSGYLICADPEHNYHTANRKWVLEQIANASSTKLYQHTITWSGEQEATKPIIAITLTDTPFTVNTNYMIELPTYGDGSNADRLKNIVSCYRIPYTVGEDSRVKIVQTLDDPYLTLEVGKAMGDFIDTVTEL